MDRLCNSSEAWKSLGSKIKPKSLAFQKAQDYLVFPFENQAFLWNCHLGLKAPTVSVLAKHFTLKLHSNVQLKT